MGKRSVREKDGDTRVIFKKSQHTIYTQSRTCSGISQINTRSGIVQIKKNLSQHQYYKEGEKIKRDLSTETGICILRRYYKNKNNRMSIQEGSKSKYSAANTEIDTIEEFQHDNSEHAEPNNEILKYDISKIMMDNFKYLINGWIEKYLLENSDAEEKLESVLYSLLHRTKLDKTSTSSSRSTYILNRERLSQEVKNKKVATSLIFQYCQHKSCIKKPRKSSWMKSSCHSTPASHKNVKVISTLSIPKNLHKKCQDKNDKSNHKFKKNKQKNVLLINKPSKLFDCPSFDLLTISTKSFTRRCATYDCDGKKKKRKKKRHIVFLPKPFYKSATDSTTDENKHKTRETKKSNLEPMPSLMKSIYADDPANITSTDDNIHVFRNDNFTMTDENNSLSESVTMKVDKVESKAPNDDIMGIDAYGSEFCHESILNEEDRSDPMMVIDFKNESLVFSQQIESKIEAVCTKTRATDTGKAKIDDSKLMKRRRKHSRRVSKFNKPEKKRLSTRNTKKSWSPNQKILGHCENILQYFADFENNTNMKLDIHITVLPVNNLQNKSTDMNKQDTDTARQTYEKCKTLIYNVESTSLNNPKSTDFNNENAHNIIPLLDGADNQSKYILKSGSCSEKVTISREINTLTIDRSTITDAEIRDDLNELKSIIKNLTLVAETFVKDHNIRKETKPSQCDNITMHKMEIISKAVQFSKEISKHPLLSGIKLSKEPKKIDYNELYNRLMRKSTSYNIIDSESVLRVTDMTSAANEIHNMNKSVKSLPNSRSMIKATSDMHRKLLAYFCDDYNTDDFIYNTCAGASTCSRIWPKRHKYKNKPQPMTGMSYSGDIAMESECDGCKNPKILCSCDTSNDDIETCITCTRDREPVCQREGMGFGEGCFYCMLMWIPVILIGSLLYSYVIKEAIYPSNVAKGLREGLPKNESVLLPYNIKLSDLGF